MQFFSIQTRRDAKDVLIAFSHFEINSNTKSVRRVRRMFLRTKSIWKYTPRSENKNALSFVL